MMYTSTRQKLSVSTAKAILDGLSKDGGLYVPKTIPHLLFNKSMCKESYLDIAKRIFKLWLSDFKLSEITFILNEAYGKNHFLERVVDLTKHQNFYLLELYHGQTLAFKDIALSAFPYMLKIAKQKEKTKQKSIILTATSGDTGSATLSGFKNLDDEVIVLYPNQNVSEFQEMQMLKFVDQKRHVIAIEGTFDDCQKIVKHALTHFKPQNCLLKTSNSINIARIIPQIVYYIYAYLQLVKNKVIQLNDAINYVIPSGNFGNALACYYAKAMGLPIHKIIIGSNQNDTLTHFFNTGIYDIRRSFIKTISPSMDILTASNIERLLYDICDKNENLVSTHMYQLKNQMFFKLDEAHMEKLHCFDAYAITDEQTKQIIKKTYDTDNTLIDPHTAVAVGSYQSYLKKTNDQTITIVVATASPFKFAKTMLESLNYPLQRDDAKNLLLLSKRTKISLDSRLEPIYLKQNSKMIWQKETAISKLSKLVGDLDVKR
jgi:threonine synthase